jgi:hypothetical protein
MAPQAKRRVFMPFESGNCGRRKEIKFGTDTQKTNKKVCHFTLK